MKKNNYFFAIILGVLLAACSMSENPDFKVLLNNKSDIALKDYPVYLELDSITNKIDAQISKLSAFIEGEAVPYQIVEMDGDKYFLTVIDLNAGESKKLSVRKADEGKPQEWKKRTHAELAIKTGGEWIDRVYKNEEGFAFVDSLRVPDELTDHSYYIKYEGPGWESDKVAYRFYLDWRNAIDIFGKITTDIALPDVGMNNYDSYHEMADWGMDILKVGGSLGMGSIGTWTGEKAERVAKTDSVITVIKADGNLYSAIRTHYYNWQSENGNVNLEATNSIIAGSRMTNTVLDMEGEIKNIATGIVKGDSIPLIKGPADTKWGYIATWGKQSLNNDNLGMAVFFKNDDAIEITEDDLSHVVVLNPGENNRVRYYFAAVWEKENGEEITESMFREYLDESIVMLERPVEIVW